MKGCYKSYEKVGYINEENFIYIFGIMFSVIAGVILIIIGFDNLLTYSFVPEVGIIETLQNMQ